VSRKPITTAELIALAEAVQTLPLRPVGLLASEASLTPQERCDRDCPPPFRRVGRFYDDGESVFSDGHVTRCKHGVFRFMRDGRWHRSPVRHPSLWARIARSVREELR
jgi:hypothetical protein